MLRLQYDLARVVEVHDVTGERLGLLVGTALGAGLEKKFSFSQNWNAGRERGELTVHAAHDAVRLRRAQSDQLRSARAHPAVEALSALVQAGLLVEREAGAAHHVVRLGGAEAALELVAGALAAALGDAVAGVRAARLLIVARG